MNKEIKRYVVWFSLIVIMSSYPVIAKEVIELKKDYRESMALSDDYFKRKELGQIEEQIAKHYIDTFSEEKPQEEAETVQPATTRGKEVSEAEKEQVRKKIMEVFGDEKFITLFTCESGLNYWKVGDAGLDTTQWHNGELLGRSTGIAQIRSGAVERNGAVWNRAIKYGMTVVEFEEALKDVDFNLKVAKEVYDKSGIKNWYNCAKRNKLIK